MSDFTDDGEAAWAEHVAGCPGCPDCSLTSSEGKRLEAARVLDEFHASHKPRRSHPPFSNGCPACDLEQAISKVERLREALGNLQQAAGSLLEADPPSRGDGRFLEHDLLLREQQARAVLADDEKED